MEELIELILKDMKPYLDLSSHRHLQESLVNRLKNVKVEEIIHKDYDYEKLFLEAKKIEGMSDSTIANYRKSLKHLKKHYSGELLYASTEDIRSFLLEYSETHSISKATLDTERRNLSSFYNWLEAEGHILKSPMKRIHKIKATKVVKKAFSDEEIERLRGSCKNVRSLAIVDMLYATGMRVSELVSLNRECIDFENRECIVIGKGDKERRVYFDAKTKIHLQEYLKQRDDDNPALFVRFKKPHDRISANGIQEIVRQLGEAANVEKCHPHRFRTTCASHAIARGMPVEQVQRLLGHEDISTTMIYALVNEESVKASHKKYIS